MHTNKTKAKLKAGETVIGCFMRHADAGLAEAVGYMGWDYLIFDGEHSPLSGRECENLARVCEINGVTPIVRVPSNMPWLIGQLFDAGMQGVQIPMINSAAEAQTAARAAKYYPLGTRGLATTRVGRFGQVQPFSLVRPCRDIECGDAGDHAGRDAREHRTTARHSGSSGYRRHLHRTE